MGRRSSSRNDAFDARGYFDDAKLPFRRNQFGFAVGGPIVRNRTFFFANYEGRRESLTTTGIATVPTQAARSGQSGGRRHHCRSRAAATSDYSHCRTVRSPATPAFTDFRVRPLSPENFFTGRMDHAISDRDHLHGTYMFDKGSTTQPDSLNVVLNFNETARQVALDRGHARLWIAIREHGARGGEPCGSGDAPDRTRPDPRIRPVARHRAGPVRASHPGDRAHEFRRRSERHLVRQLLVHDLADLQRRVLERRGSIRSQQDSPFKRIHSDFVLAANPNGVFRFNTLPDFLVNRPTSLQSQYGALTPRALRQHVFGVYIEDDYRPTETLSINLGLRYEPASVPTEVNGKLANLRTLGSADYLFR